MVVLDTFELGIVHAANPDETALSRPIVRLIADAQGNMLPDPPLVDLSATGRRRALSPNDHSDR